MGKARTLGTDRPGLLLSNSVIPGGQVTLPITASTSSSVKSASENHLNIE